MKRMITACAAASLLLALPTVGSAQPLSARPVCGVVKSGAAESPGFVRVVKGHVSCHEAVKVIRDLHTGHHQSYPLGVGSQPETYVDGWLCNEGHMGLLACWQGNGLNGNPQRMIEWEYLPCKGCEVRTPLAAAASAHKAHKHHQSISRANPITAAYKLAPLSLGTAASVAEQYAEREGHRIFRVAYLYATADCSRSPLGSFLVGTYERYGAECTMTLSLCYSTEPGIEPFRLEGQLFVWKTAPGHYRHKLEQEWEVLPAGDRGSTEHPPETLTVEGEERTISNWC